MSDDDATTTPTDCRERFAAMSAKCADIVSTSTDGARLAVMGNAYSFIDDLRQWIEVLPSDGLKQVLIFAARDYEFAMLALSQGHYKYAFAGLRAFIEHSFATAFFTAHDFDRREWASGTRDRHWATMTSEDSGVVSIAFARAYNDILEPDVKFYRSLALTMYRECSEYIHGNYERDDRPTPSLEFDEELFNRWHELCATSRMVVTFILVLTFRDQFDPSANESLRDAILDQLGHIEQLRVNLGGTGTTEQAQ